MVKEEIVFDLKDFLLLDVVRGPVNAVSRTKDKIGHIDFGMVIPPMRTFVYLSLLPFLAYPLAALHLFGFFRCLRTMQSPMLMRGYDPYETATRQYVVQKRVFDRRQKRMIESQLTDDTEQIKYAMMLCGDRRNEFVDDPNKPGTAYYVQERLIMRSEALFSGENWSWAITSDVCRYLLPVGLCFVFHPAAQRLRVDLQLWLQGRLRWHQVRHPILNFSKTANEYRKMQYRVNTTKPLPKGARPWHYNL